MPSAVNPLLASFLQLALFSFILLSSFMIDGLSTVPPPTYDLSIRNLQFVYDRILSPATLLMFPQ